MMALEVPVAAHLTVVAALVGVGVPVAVQRFLPDTEHHAEPGSSGGARASLTAWREPRTLLVGIFLLAIAFAEGAANDWISVALIDGYDASAAVGAIGFAVFLAAMTTARWFGPGCWTATAVCPCGDCARRWRPRGCCSTCSRRASRWRWSGRCWGLGTSLGFPTGMSAAADDPARSAARVSVVASVGYCAFLGGPPLIGFLGEHVGVLRALLVVGVLLAVAVPVTGALRPPPGSGEA